jgi:hypothetical protein
MTSTILLIVYLFILNSILAILFKSEFGTRVNRYKFLLLVPPLAILVWVVVFFVLLIWIVSDAIIKYFSEED